MSNVCIIVPVVVVCIFIFAFFRTIVHTIVRTIARTIVRTIVPTIVLPIVLTIFCRTIVHTIARIIVCTVVPSMVSIPPHSSIDIGTHWFALTVASLLPCSSYRVSPTATSVAPSIAIDSVITCAVVPIIQQYCAVNSSQIGPDSAEVWDATG